MPAEIQQDRIVTVDKPLRILAIVNLPWDPRLGAARVFIELTEQWKAAGHHVETFCLTDAFPKTARSRRSSTLRQLLFPNRAARYVRRNGSRFDVIDAGIGTLPFSKKSLGFDGLLVARSIGLYRAFDRFVRFSRKRWPDQPRGTFLGRYFHRLKRKWLARKSGLAVRHCDLVNLPNDEEQELLPELQRTGKAAIIEPYGLNENDLAALAGAAQPSEARLKAKEICFIGMWGLRKGAGDWPEIVRHIRRKLPDTQFKLLGIMTDDQKVLSDLRLSPGDGVRCVSAYDPKELPSLISSCAVGLFPSYIEGFGLAVLEQLAAGIPTVAYDVAGPRQILKPFRADLLVPEGDAIAMADRAVEILRMNPIDYTTLSTQCRSIAGQFRWERIAPDTAQRYHVALEKLRSRR